MKIVDLSTDVAGRFAAKLFAMAGVEVSRPFMSGAEGPPDTDDPLSLYLDSDKRPIPIDDEDSLEGLLKGADLLFTSFDAGRYLGLAARRSLLPPTCVEVTTSTFGTNGPYAGLRGGPLADWSAGGYLAITGEPTREPLIGPETLCAYVAGYTAAVGAEAALRRRGAHGRAQHVDVSTMEAMLCLHQSTFSRLGAGIVRQRTGRYAEVYPLVVCPCRSGYVSLGVVSDEEFDRLAIGMGLADLAADPRFATREARWDNRDALDEALAPWLMRHSADEIVETLQANGVAATRVVDAHEILANPQFDFRNFWVSPPGRDDIVMPGNPIPEAKVFAECGARSGAPVASPGLPLEGVVVLDFTAFWAGPSATRCLADMGADVIWVERPRSRLDPDEKIAHPGVLAQHLYHLKMNRHKRSVILDLETPAGREAALALAAKADIVVENFRPGVADRLGLGPSALCTAFPRLVYVSLSGFGGSGPWESWRSYGPNIEAASSILARTGYAGGEPLRLGHALPDGVGGVAGALAALRGLRERDERGVAGWFDISQLEVYAALSGEAILAASISGAAQPRIGNRSHSGAVQGVFPCRGDDQWIAIRLVDQADMDRFATETGIAVCGTPRDDALIGAYSAGRDKHELARALQGAGLEALPVLTSDELAADSHLQDRGFFTTVTFADRRCLLPGSPLHCDPPLADPNGTAPRFGEHTDEILAMLKEA